MRDDGNWNLLGRLAVCALLALALTPGLASAQGRFVLPRSSEDAIHAMVWGLCVDGRTPLAEGILAPVLRDAKKHDAAWILEHARAFPASPAATPAPFAHDLPRTRTYLAPLAAPVDTPRDPGLPRGRGPDHPHAAGPLGRERPRARRRVASEGDSRMRQASGTRDINRLAH